MEAPRHGWTCRWCRRMPRGPRPPTLLTPGLPTVDRSAPWRGGFEGTCSDLGLLSRSPLSWTPTLSSLWAGPVPSAHPRNRIIRPPPPLWGVLPLPPTVLHFLSLIISQLKIQMQS